MALHAAAALAHNTSGTVLLRIVPDELSDLIQLAEQVYNGLTNCQACLPSLNALAADGSRQVEFVCRRLPSREAQDGHVCRGVFNLVFGTRAGMARLRLAACDSAPADSGGVLLIRGYTLVAMAQYRRSWPPWHQVLASSEPNSDLMVVAVRLGQGNVTRHLNGRLIREELDEVFTTGVRCSLRATSTRFQVVAHLLGGYLAIEVNEHWTFADLASAVSAVNGYPPSQVRFMYQGQHLLYGRLRECPAYTDDDPAIMVIQLRGD